MGRRSPPPNKITDGEITTTRRERPWSTRSSLGEPQRATHIEGQNYLLYRVVGTFTAQMEFSDFPFDEQFLPIVIRGITFSQLAATTQVSRDVGSFLAQNLLPLILLTAVTYVSLWLPVSEAARISLAVTGILTGAVMLAKVTGSLPTVDCTVAIEWAYYAFIGLSALCVLLALVGRRYESQRRLSSLRTLEVSARIAYPVLVGLVLVGYWVAFH